MKRFIASLGVIMTLTFLLCCCTNTSTPEASVEDSENAASSEEKGSFDVVEQSTETSIVSEGTSTVEDSTKEEVSNAESVDDPSSEESASSASPVYSEAPPKEPETIPSLILGPKPEDGDSHVLYVGESLQLYSQIEGSELEDAMLLWKISDKSVISFGNKKVTALKAGESTVTLSYSNGLKAVSLKFVVLERELSEASSTDC